MEFRVLGPLEVLDGDRIVAIGGGRRRTLLALLLLHRNTVVPAERLIDELWDGRPPPTAVKGLQVHVSQLRKELARGAPHNGTALLTQGLGYVLQVDATSIDAVRFEQAVAEAARLREDGRAKEALALLRDALAMWRGPPLADFAYESFAREEIARLEELRVLALEERIEAELALGRHRAVLAEAEQLARAHPTRERPRALLMLALYRSGRRGDALQAYREGRRLSIDILGLEPGPELRALEAGILGDDPALVAPAAGIPPPRRMAATFLGAAAVLLAAAASAALVIEDGARPPRAAPALDLATNSVAALGRDGRPAFAVPLPGRPTDVAASGDHLFAVSINSSALTIVDGRTRRLVRTVPLPMRPAAVAVRGDDVWVADGRRGLLVRLDAGYEHIAARVRWRRAPGREAVGLSRLEPTAVAVAAGDAWVSDGSPVLMRADRQGAVRPVRLPHPADGVAAGAGAVWAFSRRRAAVMRLDVRTSRVSDVVPIVGRPGSEAPAPIAIAAGHEGVWVLNGNTATLSRIDPRTRGVTTTTQLPIEQQPRDIELGRSGVWVACFDGSVVRVPGRGGRPRTSFAGASLIGVAAHGDRAWIAATALDQQIPGGDG